MREKEYIYPFTLTAADVGPWLEMPLSSLVVAVIDVATAHANRVGLGFDVLRRFNASWVLGRLAADIVRMPRVGGEYELRTWVETFSRLASDRGFALIDRATGECIVRIHTVWMAIDLDERRPVDLSVVGDTSDFLVAEPEYPSKCGRIPPLKCLDEGYDYTFKVSDIDVNRHVTTRRYIDLMVDLRPLELYASSRLRRFEIAFRHEALYGQTARVALCGTDSSITVGDTLCAIARMEFEQG